MTDDLITLKKSKLKSSLSKLITVIHNLYLGLLKNTTFFWTKIFEKEGKLRILLEEPAIVLFFNTLLFAFVGNFFGGLVGQVAIGACFLNILMFLFEKIGWINKLK